MATNTYVALDKVTISSATNNVSFTSIPSTYTDLQLVVSGTAASNSYLTIRFNNDTTSTYSHTEYGGDGSAAYSARQSSSTYGYTSSIYTTQSTTTYDVLNYSNTTTFKTYLSNNVSASSGTKTCVGLWRATAQAINRIDIGTAGGPNFSTGTTFSLYGTSAEGVSPAAKATGGAIYSDSTYYYHVFTSTGTFTPVSSLSADILVVAGGGGGGGNIAGGGGAGGLRNGTLSLTATGYAVTVGAGGAKGTGNNTDCTSGVDSVFSSITSAGGGRGASDNAARPALAGGSGGGGSWSLQSGGAGNTPSTSPSQGNNGANALPSNFGSAGGGGGAGAAGTAGSATVNAGGDGGAGSSTYSSWSTATGIGQNVSGIYYLAGGGGGGRSRSGTTASSIGGLGGGGVGGFDGGSPNTGTVGGNGSANMGAGGGGAAWGSAQDGGNGGSGVVIVRYAKA